MLPAIDNIRVLDIAERVGRSQLVMVVCQHQFLSFIVATAARLLRDADSQEAAVGLGSVDM